MEKLPFTKKTVLEIDWLKCPDNIRDLVSKKEQFRNRTCIKHISELTPFGSCSYKDTLTIKEIEKYYKDQCAHNYNGDINSFIKDYGLEIDKWLIDTGYDFTGIDQIIFNISY